MIKRTLVSLEHLIKLNSFSATELAMAEAAREKDWNSLVALAENSEDEINPALRRWCLPYAMLYADTDTFKALLEAFPHEEYAGTIWLAGTPEDPFDSHCTLISGTLITIAATAGKTELLEYLLSRGYDVNSASEGAKDSLSRLFSDSTGFYGAVDTIVSPYAAPVESHLQVMMVSDDGSPVFPKAICNALTPLAAAIICGRAECAEILLRHGAWRQEAPSVTRALMHEDTDSAFRKMVLSYSGKVYPMALWAAITSCSPDMLKAELSRCRYSDEEIALAVEALAAKIRYLPPRIIDIRKMDFEKVRILEKYAPHVLRRPENCAQLLRWGMMQNCNEEYQQFLLSLCPEEMDLSCIREGFARMQAKSLCRFIEQICSVSRCTMDRNALPLYLSPAVLKTLIRCVSFHPPKPGGEVSKLTKAILHSNDLPLIRKALKSGLIPTEESTADLLRCHKEGGCTPASRTLLLTVTRPEGSIDYKRASEL